MCNIHALLVDWHGGDVGPGKPQDMSRPSDMAWILVPDRVALIEQDEGEHGKGLLRSPEVINDLARIDLYPAGIAKMARDRARRKSG